MAATKAAKPSEKDQYDRFQQTARDLGVDGDESGKAFGGSFQKDCTPKGKD
jgi:hypothetical protein